MSNIEKFGKYLLLEKLAVGGMAEVYLTKTSGANGVSKFVALKRILPQFSGNPEFIAMFKEEAKVAINLSHSNIVSIYDFGIESDQFYLVMEYVEGRNLRQIINEMKKSNKSFSIDQAVYMIKETAAGLNHAHRCADSQSGKPLNITHRDMSPQNIMVSFEGETKVIDFGIAKSETENEATKAGTLKGKFSYMSPEQSEGYPIDPRTDVFALGIILWELLANDRLFTGSNEGAILRKVRDCQVPGIRKINPLVPQELERIVMKALAKDKNVRYQTAANFYKDLNLFLNTQYPDFSTHDFSQFIRDCFKNAYAEGKEKLISYSKVESPTEPTTTVSSKKLSETITLPANISPPQAMNAVSAVKLQEFKNQTPIDKNQNDIELLKGIKPETSEKVNLDGLSAITMNHRLSKKSVGGIINPLEAKTNHTKSYVTNSQAHINVKLNTEKDSSFKELFPKIALILIISITGFFGYKNLYSTSSKRTLAAKTIEIKEVPAGKIDMATTASTRLSVSSEPSGARISIDGVATSQLTPSIITVTSNKIVTITLSKEGFYKYQSAKEYSGAASLNANMIPTPPMGYLNIYVENGGENPVVSINGNRLSEKLPINQYAVPAGDEIEVSAINPFSQLSDSVKIKVSENKIQTIQLVLGRNKK